MRFIRTASFVALTAAALAGTLVTALPAAAANSYVALGDSYSAGTGAGNYDGSGCRRSAYAYPHLWDNAHAGTTLYFRACAGARTDEVLANQVGWLNSGTTHVSISIGGNDIDFAGMMFTCATGSDQACVNKVNDSRATAQNELPAKLDKTYAAIRNRAPNARIVVLGYPRLFASNPSSCGMSYTKRTTINQAANELSGIIANRVAAAGLSYEDVRDNFSGHEVCSSSPWINGYLPFSVIDSYHPNRTGQNSGYYQALESRM